MNSKMAICLLCAVAVAVPTVSRADEAPPATPAETSTSAPTDYKQMYEDQKKRNDELEKRIGLLEEKDKTEPYVKSADLPETTLKFLKGIELSGFVSSSYTYNFNKPADRINNGRLYDYAYNEFMLNKLTLIMQTPVDYNAFDWKAGHFSEFIFGQDAQSTRAKSPDTSDGLFNLGDNGDVEQAYIIVNAPVGNGLKIMIGKYVTPMGYELVENELTANWSSGWQWTFIEPFTHTGVELSYKINDKWEAQLLVNNGWDTVKDNNSSKSFMGHINYTPNDKTWIGITPFAGPEQSDAANDPDNAVPGANGNWRTGIDVAMTHKCTDKLNTALQFDYGQEEGGDINGGTATWWAAGMWTTYDFTEKLQAAFRADFLSDRDGNRTSGFLFPENTGQDLYSLTLTLNIKPVEGLRFAPELRYDHSSLDTAFDNHDDQVTAAFGAVYSF